MARISGGNANIVRYLAENLNMYSYYGPKTVTGTFGIALLSKYPILDAQTFYMSGAGEQTATIVVNVKVGEKIVRVFNAHLGNGGPLIQQQTILNEIRDSANVILMGDFNFTSDSIVSQQKNSPTPTRKSILQNLSRIESTIFFYPFK